MATKTNDESESEVFTLLEASKFLKISERTLWELARAGDVPSARVGSQYRFLKSRLVERLTQQA